MHRSPAIRSGIAVFVIGLVAAACMSGGGNGSASPGASAAPSAPPVTSATTAASATAYASRAATVSPVAGSPSPVAAAPPDATLAVDGGDPVAGQLGSYTWNGNGSDSPWLPGAPITVGTGERLTASLDPDVGVAMWSARQVAAGTSDGAGAVGLGDGAAPVSFAAPGPGRWSVQVMVGFAGELGSATYYWDVTVR
jgi:hypothetical protein